MLGGKAYIAQSLFIEYCPKVSLFRYGFTMIFAGLKLLVYTNINYWLKKNMFGCLGGSVG